MSNSYQAKRRTETILALAASGLTQGKIAEKLNISKKTVERHLATTKAALSEAQALMDNINSEFAKLQNPERIARNYVELAEKDSNGSVRLTAQDRILEYRGVVTEKERFRRDKGTETQPAPMFTLAPGASVNVTVNQVAQTSSRSSDPAIDVTPVGKSSDLE